jgi:predicted SAM-dependent methyltransferase
MEENLGINLNLGAGKIKWPNWLTVGLSDSDINCDLRQLDLPNDYADQAAAIHVLEHFYQWDALDVLKEWRRVLKPGGKLILELPCIDKVIGYLCRCVEKGIPLSNTMSWHALYGDPKYKDPLMTHKWGYTVQMLTALLEEAGFHSIEYQKPRYHFPDRDMRFEAIK